VERLACVGTLISSLELLARPNLYKEGQLMSWEVGQLRSSRLVRGLSGRWMTRLMAYPVFRGLLALRLAASAILLVRPASQPKAGTLRFAVAASSIAITMRSPFGWDGADQMSSITFVGLTAASWLPELKSDMQRFLAYQLCLSYLASGVAKAVSPEWRSGTALTGIFSTRMYGDERIYRFLRDRPRWAALLSRVVIVGECAFSLALMAPRRVRRCILAGGLLFHFAVALTMNLNTFFWSFAAAYPALEAYCRSKRLGGEDSQNASVVLGRQIPIKEKPPWVNPRTS
jgi:hypothetical protein